jgi:hypothetical protein
MNEIDINATMTKIHCLKVETYKIKCPNLEEESQPSKNEMEKTFSKVIEIIMAVTHLLRDIR